MVGLKAGCSAVLWIKFAIVLTGFANRRNAVADYCLECTRCILNTYIYVVFLFDILNSTWMPESSVPTPHAWLIYEYLFIAFQFPEDYISKEVFDTISAYIIPKPPIQQKCTMTM